MSFFLFVEALEKNGPFSARKTVLNGCWCVLRGESGSKKRPRNYSPGLLLKRDYEELNKLTAPVSTHLHCVIILSELGDWFSDRYHCVRVLFEGSPEQTRRNGL